MDKLKQFWASLPHQVQALVVAFASGAGTYFLDNPHFTISRASLSAAIAAGLVAARALYMIPNKPQALTGSDSSSAK